VSLLGRQRKIFMADVSGCTYKRVSGRQPRRRGRMLSIARRTIASNGIQPPGQLSADDSFGRQSDGADRAGACAAAAVEFAQARASGCAVRTIAFPLPPARGGRSPWRPSDRPLRAGSALWRTIAIAQIQALGQLVADDCIGDASIVPIAGAGRSQRHGRRRRSSRAARSSSSHGESELPLWLAAKGSVRSRGRRDALLLDQIRSNLRVPLRTHCLVD
jgi:hypothetical protein